MEVDGCTFTNCGTSNLGVGLLAVCNTGFTRGQIENDLQIYNCIFHDNGNTPTSTGADHSAYFGSQGNTTTDPVGIDGWVIANCLFYDQGSGFNLQLGDSASNGYCVNNTFDHNFTSNTSAANIMIWRGGGTPSSNNLFLNNLITNSTHWGIFGTGSANSSNVVRNNLVFGNASGNYGGGATYTVTNTASTSDPKYNNYAGKDFSLQSISPAKGKSEIDYTPPTDITGATRTSTPSLGAYE
jgi:hypothetical protein